MQRMQDHIEHDQYRNITKRQIGLAFLVLGVLAFGGILALDILRHKQQGIGPAQLMALAACFGIAVLGVTLILAGDRPA